MERIEESLADYFRKLKVALDEERITDERKLSRYVEVPDLALAWGFTLLERMGYDAASAKPQRPMERRGTSTPRLDFGLRCGALEWPLEIKAPAEDLTNKDHVAQLRSYQKELKSPIGVLFNGNEASVLVDRSLFGRLPDKLNESDILQPAFRCRLENPKEMVALFSRLARTDEPGAIRKFAKSLARKRLNELINVLRLERIARTVAEIKLNPDEATIHAIIAASSALTQDNAIPSEVRRAWNGERSAERTDWLSFRNLSLAAEQLAKGNKPVMVRMPDGSEVAAKTWKMVAQVMLTWALEQDRLPQLPFEYRSHGRLRFLDEARSRDGHTMRDGGTLIEAGNRRVFADLWRSSSEIVKGIAAVLQAGRLPLESFSVMVKQVRKDDS